MHPSIITVLVLLLSASVSAQPAGEIVVDVPIRWMQTGDGADRRTDPGAAASFEHRFNHEQGRLFYDMKMDAFGTDQPLRTWLHNAGATVSFGSTTRAFDVGGSFFWRANEGAWSAADFRGVNLLASARLQPLSTVTVTGTYGLYVRAFPEQPALDHTEHLGSARAVANFVTRTTIAAAFSTGQKRYSEREPVVSESVLPTLSGGRGFGRSLLASARTQLAGEFVARMQWTWALRLAQSLDERTGVWIERESRHTAGQLSPAIIWTPPLFYEDGVYDDPYVVEAATWRAGIKHVFASGHELEGWWSQSTRTYTGLERSDRLSRAGAQAVVPLIGSRAAALDLVMDYSYFHNDSSDTLESYQASRASAGVRIRF
jgi:hypothetical protein